MPLLVVSMVPALQFMGWQWLAFLLASIVVLWGGKPFHVAAWANARHGATTMDTLVSMGTLAAYLPARRAAKKLIIDALGHV